MNFYTSVLSIAGFAFVLGDGLNKPLQIWNH